MKTQTVRIMDCAEVSPGFSTRAGLRDDPAGTHQVVMGKHLTRGQPYVYRERDRLRIKPGRDVSRYVLEPGDLLYVSRGLTNYPVLIESVPGPTITVSSFFILKPRANVVPAYLAWCLEQTQTVAHITALRTGAATPTIPTAGFREIPIPLPEKGAQHRIAELWRLENKERNLRQQLLDETARLHRLAGQRIFEHLMDGREGT